jgi:MerR family transcriptional regulator/heat shock protein HspR
MQLEADLRAAHRRIVELEALRAYPRPDLLPGRDSASTALVVWKPRRAAE